MHGRPVLEIPFWSNKEPIRYPSEIGITYRVAGARRWGTEPGHTQRSFKEVC
jgi:hypothetical protein